MNVAVQARETRRPVFPAAVHTYTDALRVLAAADQPMTAEQIAQATDRVPSNVRRDLPRLQDADVVSVIRMPADPDDPDAAAAYGYRITHKGALWLAGQDVAEGRAPASAEGDPTTVWLTADQIEWPESNPGGRTRSGIGLFDLSLEELAASIVEQGILQAITVRPPLVPGGPWRRLIGERRHRAWMLAVESGRLPADKTFRCEVFQGDDDAAEEAALIENLQRVDLDDLEVAEALAALHLRTGRSAAEIARRLGKTGGNDSRWVEERIKVGKEATADNKARYLAWISREEGQTVERFTWTDLRNSVKEARHLAALRRAPALALLLAETAQQSELDAGLWDGPVPVTDAAATDTTLAQAIDLGLVISYSPGEIELTQLACDWLAGEGFGEDRESRDTLLNRLRHDALGAIGAAALEGYGTAILNLPPPTHHEPVDTAGHAPPVLAAPASEPEPGSDSEDEVSAEDEEEEDFPDHLRRLAGGGAGVKAGGGGVVRLPDCPCGDNDGRACTLPDCPYSRPDVNAAPTPTPAPAPASAPVQESLILPSPSRLAGVNFTRGERLIMVEVAHATAHATLTARGGEPAAPIHGFQSDKAAQQLPMKRAMGFWQRPTGGWVAFLPEAARRLVEDWHPAGIDADVLRQARLAAGLPEDVCDQLAASGVYATGWLNAPAQAAPPAAAAPPPPPAPRFEGATSPPMLKDPAAPAGDIVVAQTRDALGALWRSASAAVLLLRRIELGEGAGDEEVTATTAQLHHDVLNAAQFVPASFKPERPMTPPAEEAA